MCARTIATWLSLFVMAGCVSSTSSTSEAPAANEEATETSDLTTVKCGAGPELSARAMRLYREDARKLEELWSAGRTPSLESMRGHAYLGINQGAFLDQAANLGLGFQRFVKTFYDDPTGKPMGHNFVVAQARQEEGPYCVTRTSNGAGKRQGFYALEAAPREAPWDRHATALFLDYGKKRELNGLDPAGLLRDFVVQPFADEPNILLGRAFLALPNEPTVGFFVLERTDEIDVRL